MTLAIRDEYAPRFGRQVLTLWSGGFASDYEGEAVELPKHDGSTDGYFTTDETEVHLS